MTRTVITSETPVEMARDEQIGQVKGLLDPILRKLTKDQIQAIIHAGGEFQMMFNNGLGLLLREILAEKAITDGKFDSYFIGLSLEMFPLNEEPVESVQEVCLNEWVGTRAAMMRINVAGKKFASPLTALRYATKYPEKQLCDPLAVIFEIDGDLWHLILGRDRSKRRLTIGLCGLGYEWGESFHFLVVDNDK